MTCPAVGASISSPAAKYGSRLMVANSVMPMAKPPTARANRTKPGPCGGGCRCMGKLPGSRPRANAYRKLNRGRYCRAGNAGMPAPPLVLSSRAARRKFWRGMRQCEDGDTTAAARHFARPRLRALTDAPARQPRVKAPRTVILANPWAVGDVIMTLPLGGAIRRHWPGVRLYFAAQHLALPQACEFFDGVIDSNAILADPAILKRMGTDVFLNPFSNEDLARAAFAARVPVRVGNLFRRRSAAFHNRFVAYGNTGYAHMLGFALRHVRAIGVPVDPLPSDPRLLFGLTRVGAPPEQLKQQLDPRRFNLILHPKSGGSGREWPLEYYLELARELVGTNDFKLFVTGSEKERQVVERDCPELLSSGLTTDVMGRLSLGELMAFIQVADGLLASGTGPLHIAAALGRHALGI